VKIRKYRNLLSRRLIPKKKKADLYKQVMAVPGRKFF